MREIRFRAWDKSEKRLIGDSHYLYMDISDGQINDINKDDFREDLILMQYFDLKDKNNKDIFDSDYVKFKIPKSLKKLEHIKEIRLIKFPEDFLWVQTQHNEIEVVGNLYENPELGGLI